MNTVIIAAAIWLQAVPTRSVVVCDGAKLITCWIDAEREQAMKFPVARKPKTEPQKNREPDKDRGR